MATANPQGIMALPTGDAPAETRAPAQPQLGLDDSYDAVQQGLQNASPDASSAVNAELAKIVPQLDQLPDDILDQLLQVIQFLHDNPDKYAQAVKELVDEGIIDEGDFPEEYDPEFLATFGMIIMQARKSRRGAQGAAPVTPPLMPPVGMARGGIAEAVNMVASQGRGQDTMLAHINPREAQMLRSMGGVGTLNPVTGLPEYGLFKAIGNVFKAAGNVVKDAVKSVGTAVKQVVSSPVGRVLATVAIAAFAAPFLTAMAPTLLASGSAALAGASTALASGAITALGGGNLKDVLKSAAIGGATAFFGAPGGPVSNFVGGAVTNAAANAAISSGIVGTGIGLLSGQKLQDAVKSGITAGAISGLTTGATKGFDAQIEMPKAPTVGEMLDQNRPTAQQLEGYVKPDGATSDAVRGFGEVQGSPLSPADAGSYMQPAGTDGLTPLMDPATGGVQTVAADGRVYEVFKRPDGTSMFRPTTGSGADAPAFMKGNVIARMGSDQISNVASTAPPADASGVSSSYTGTTSTGPAYDTGFGSGRPDAGSVVDMRGPLDINPNAELSSDYRGSAGGGAAPVTSSAGTGGSLVAGPYEPPTVGRAYDEFGRGEYGKGFKTVFMPEGPTPAQVVGTQEYQDLIALRNPNGTPIYTGKEAIAQVTESMSPGIIRTYGPATAAGLGIAGLAGAFTPKKPEPSPEEKAMNARLQAERDRVAANPGAYVPQGLERFGIQYDDRGQIIGSQPFNPQPLGPTEVAGNYMPYTPSPYMTPSGGIGNPFIARPYNTSSMYDFMPRYAATGGIMSAMPSSNSSKRNAGGIASLARGGYPRRTGQISGPGTGTSDSIPAMLSDGEFVMTAKAVRGAGKGNRLAGAKKMYALMHQLERNAARG
jgi:hypothetical protein